MLLISLSYGAVAFSLSDACLSIIAFCSSIDGCTPSYAELILSCSVRIFSCISMSLVSSTCSSLTILSSDLVIINLFLTMLSSIRSSWATF